MYCSIRFSQLKRYILGTVAIFLIALWVGMLYGKIQENKKEMVVEISPDLKVNASNCLKTEEDSRIENKPVLVPTYHGFDVVGKLEIPVIALQTYILKDTSEESLRKGATKFCGPSLNTQGNFCIAGHNFNNGKIFANLHKLKLGDEIVLTDPTGKQLTYSIFDIFVTAPNDVGCLKNPVDGSTQVTLITCTKTGLRRLIIQAKVIEE